MSALGLARWQFGTVTLYHFIFVPLTIGLAFLVAVLQTAWHRSGDERYLRLTRFWGKLFLINFAIGVVTGLVQEFQFGMNWSSYSRYVGDVFGAPLAIEGLAAFFLESTFLGLWIFGWGRLPRRVHLATIWTVAVGTMLSAYFILAANSWMQHPVGYRIDPASGRAQLTSILAVLTNSTLLYAFTHTMFASLLTGSMVMLGVSCWHLRRGREVELFRRSATIALIVAFPAGVAAMLSGHAQAQLMTRQQPMKMAAAEALWETQAPAGFSLFATGGFARNPGHTNVDVVIPHALSLLATNTLNGEVKGIDQVQAEERARYGPGDYVPIVGVTYWGFRIMVGMGSLAALLAAVGLWLVYRGRLAASTRFHRLAVGAIVLPFIANSAGWVFTEMGRQPWVVQGLMLTRNAVSPSVSAWLVATSLTVFTLLYGALACIDGWLMGHYARIGPDEAPDPGAGAPEPAAMSY